MYLITLSASHTLIKPAPVLVNKSNFYNVCS
jgi:hypothetical protein